VSYCCYFSLFTTSKPESIVFIAIVRIRAGEENNLELPFPSQSNIMGKKNPRADVRSSRIFFFLLLGLSTGAQPDAAGF